MWGLGWTNERWVSGRRRLWAPFSVGGSFTCLQPLDEADEPRHDRLQERLAGLGGRGARIAEHRNVVLRRRWPSLVSARRLHRRNQIPTDERRLHTLQALQVHQVRAPGELEGRLQ